MQCRESEVERFSPYLHGSTRVAVNLERAFLREMEGGCQSAFAAHYAGGKVHLFHDDCGYKTFQVPGDDAKQVPEDIVEAILGDVGLKK